MAPTPSVYQRDPEELPKPHPRIRKLSPQYFVFYFTQVNPPRENLVTATEIAEAIKVDTLLRQNRTPVRWPLMYGDIASHFNHGNSNDDRRFIEYDMATKQRSFLQSTPPSFNDFGITPHHLSGGNKPSSSLITNRRDEKVVFGAVVRTLEEQAKQLAASKSHKRHRVDSTPTPSLSTSTSGPLPSDTMDAANN
ncbi:hypothetical protein EST38_g14248 [Candolleomyces aberdarensis]|uniref:Uncharacterized protein n=1 Tax=Candolleomyces aberdarensis TaxID=2316362 RepID=A0A4Q2CXS4_9AGAR|nr:hypothetical protein EST38_g14248 [Candolleomyces aberdarensis]